MAGMFDDLIPQQGAPAIDFADLIPKDPLAGKRASERTGAAIAGAADMASAGLGDEMMAGMKSWPALLTSKLDFNQVYDKNLAKGRADQDAIRERNPIWYGGGQVLGAVGTGLAGATTKAGAALTNLAGRGLLPNAASAAGKIANLGTKAVGSSAIGAIQGGAYGFGSGEGDNRADTAKSGATIGGVVGGLAPGVGAVASQVGKEIKSLAPAAPETSKALRKAAGPLFDKFTKSGATYSPQLTNEIADLADSVRAQGIAGQTKEADAALNKSLDFYSSLRGKALSPADVQKLDQSFADDVARFNKSGEYNFGRVLNDLKYEFRSRAFDPQKAGSYVASGAPDAVESLKAGNQLWSQSYKAKDIEKILQKSQGTENPQTSIRTGLKNLLANDKKMAAYSDEEKAILQDAMKRGYTGGLIKLLGGRMVDAIAGGVAGAAAGGPVGAVAGAVAGKAVGGVMADAAGGIQANRLRGALQQIQSGKAASVAAKPVGNSATPLLSGAAGGEAVGLTLPKAPAQTVTKYEPLNYSAEVAEQPQPQLEQQSAVTPDLLQKFAQVESGGKVNAQAPTSSAKGLFQFTNSKWKEMVGKYGAQTGVTLKDIFKPEAQMMMAAASAMEHEEALSKALGRQPTATDLYAAHFLGLGGAKKLLSNLGSKQNAVQLFPAAAKANRNIFYDKLRPRTVDEVYQVLRRKVS